MNNYYCGTKITESDWRLYEQKILPNPKSKDFLLYKMQYLNRGFGASRSFFIKDFDMDITATYAKKDWDNSGDLKNNNRHIVSIKKGREEVEFDYWQSISECRVKTEKDALFAFRCFVEDALCGLDTFEEFCSNLGYDVDSRKAEKVHQECIKQMQKFVQLFGIDNMGMVLEKLSEMGIE